MKRFMIGQFDKFNFDKQARDFRKDFFGIEVCHMDSLENLEETFEYVRREDIQVGFHFPVLNHQWHYRDPQYMSLDPETKRESMEYMASEFKRAERFEPTYVLTHYPKPVILDERVDWSSWRFADRSEYYYESEYSLERFTEESEAFFKWLSAEGNKSGFTPILELDAVNQFIYDTDLLQNLLETYPNVRLCLDIGRIHLQDTIDENFSGLDLVDKYAKYADLVHLWNVKVDTNVSNGHYPALRSLRPDEGWADVEAYLKAISKKNKTFKVLFEHKSHLITDEELQSCYDWVAELIK